MNVFDVSCARGVLCVRTESMKAENVQIDAWAKNFSGKRPPSYFGFIHSSIWPASERERVAKHTDTLVQFNCIAVVLRGHYFGRAQHPLNKRECGADRLRYRRRSTQLLK